MKKTIAHQKAALLLLLLSLACSGISQAHPALESRLKSINAQLQKQPGDAELLLSRGNLYLEHGEPEMALPDLQQATLREPTLSEAWFTRARIEAELGKTEEALHSNSTFLTLLQQAPASAAVVSGLVQQGDIYRAASRPAEAARSYQRAIAASAKPTPEQYLLLAETQQQNKEYDAAIQSIELAIKQQGDLPQLLEKATAIELARQNPQAALVWLDRLLLQQQRHEYLLLDKARIQRSIPDERSAQASLDAALLAIESLPKTRRYSEATLSLEKAILHEKAAGKPDAIPPQQAK